MNPTDFLAAIDADWQVSAFKCDLPYATTYLCCVAHHQLCPVMKTFPGPTLAAAMRDALSFALNESERARRIDAGWLEVRGQKA